MNKVRKSSFLLPVMLVGGILSILLLSFIHINQGSLNLSIQTIIQAIISPKDMIEHNVIRSLRIPRLLIGIIAGGALSVSGSLFQSLMKNPLASSSTLGINAGSYFFVILFSVFLPEFTSIPFFPALLGAFISAVIVLNLGGGKKANPIQMTLAGVALSLVFSSITSAIQILFENETKGLFLWGSGSLMQTSWRGVIFSFPIVIIFLIISIFLSKKFDILQLGDDTAASLGLNVSMYRYFGIILGVILTSSVIAIVGPIGFVGLISPHVIKMLGFKKHKIIFILSFIWGAVILISADIISRLFTKGSYELPVGAFTAILGAPWLIYLAYRTGKNISNNNQGLIFHTTKKTTSYFFKISLLIGLTIIVFLISIRFGGQDYSLKEIFSTFFGNGNSISDLIINQIRLPRILTALLAGIALALSGFLLQTVLNNTLADPSILGVTDGAALGALIAIYFLSKNTNFFIPLTAFIGAILTAFIIFRISKKSKYNPAVLVLVGMAVSAFFSAGVNIIIISTAVGKSASLIWLAGSTYGSTWNNVYLLIFTLILAFPIIWMLSKELDAIILGKEVATALGSNVSRVRIFSSIIGVSLAAVAVTTVGTVGFIGLLAPHISRFITGSKHKKNIFIVGFIGGLLLLTSDFIGRVAIYPNEIPSGLVVSIIGAPYFLWLLYSLSKIKR